ncbi:unnamed protein product [Mytilus edulis]|uniref:Uncharacterized protein n=1 Tax=Mytilus edulis TaxID=6550 RepID=A0A8S3RZN3_MYTED|nr:unnamed protein product [Mytilus edulis]
MADNVTQNISIALYRFMCQNIVGTEDHVKQLRLINTVRDNLSSDEKMTFITSGSFGEGLEMRGSDLDIMFVLKDMKIQDVKSSSHKKIRYWTMDTDDVKAGFTKLYCENTCGMSNRTLEEVNENSDADFSAYNLNLADLGIFVDIKHHRNI